MSIVATPSLAPKSTQKCGSCVLLIAFYWPTRVVYFRCPLVQELWRFTFDGCFTLFDGCNVMQFSNGSFSSRKHLNNSLKLKPFSNCHWLQPDYVCAQDYSGVKNGWTANFWGFFSSQKMQQKWMFFLKLISKLESCVIAFNWQRKKKVRNG